MAISQFNRLDFVDVIHKGMLQNIREAVISRIMADIEKDVTASVDKVLEHMKGYVSQEYANDNNTIVYNVVINGVPYQQQTGQQAKDTVIAGAGIRYEGEKPKTEKPPLHYPVGVRGADF